MSSTSGSLRQLCSGFAVVFARRRGGKREGGELDPLQREDLENLNGLGGGGGGDEEDMIAIQCCPSPRAMVMVDNQGGGTKKRATFLQFRSPRVD